MIIVKITFLLILITEHPFGKTEKRNCEKSSAK